MGLFELRSSVAKPGLDGSGTQYRLRLTKAGRKRRKPAPGFSHPLAIPVGAMKDESYSSCSLKESDEDRCAVASKKTHPWDVFKAGK